MEALSNDLVRQCLLRVPCNSHDNLKAVCRSWEAMVSSPTFYADRKLSGTSEQLIGLVQTDERNIDEYNLVSTQVFVITVYDPVKGTSQRLSPIDDPRCIGIPLIRRWCDCVVVVVNRKLILIGGFHPSFHPSCKSLMTTVYIYDFESATWSRGADMPTARSFFACSVSPSTGVIYVAGGINERFDSLTDAEAYDVEEDKWEILPPMTQQHGQGCHGVFMEGKFMVIGGGDLERSAEIFDWSAGTWRSLEDMWSLGGYPGRSCAVASSSGELYAFSTIEQQVLKYEIEKNLWIVVASLPRYITFFTCATQWRDWIFVSGSTSIIQEKCISYLFNPSTRKLIEVNGDGWVGFGSMVVSAATVEI